MEFNELIRIRQSVRNYDPDRPVPMEILQKILDAGRVALSAANRQPWRFLLVSSPEMLERVKRCYDRDWFQDAPHVLVVVGLKNKAWVRKYDGYNSIETDLAIAMTHMILAAENEGVGACWIAAYDPVRLNEAIKPAQNEVIFGITPLGYQRSGYKKEEKTSRKQLTDIIEIV
jgi:nitroreductase